MGSSSGFGPAKPTLVERVIGFRGTPYTIGCALWAAYATQLGLFFSYLDTFDYNRALVVGVFFGRDPATVTSIQLLSERVLSFVGAFSIFYVVRYMRVKVMALTPLLAFSLSSEEVFYKSFGRVSSTRWPVAIMAPFWFFPIGTLVSGYLPAPGIVPIPGVFSVVHFAITSPLLFLGIFTFVWVYFSAVWGIHRLGREIRLRPFYEDSSLGTRPLGGLSLSLAIGYFVGWGSYLLATGAAFSPSSAGPIAGAIAFVLLGTAMFFLPLKSLHKRMAEQKAREQASLLTQFAQLTNRSSNAGSDNSGETLVRMERILMLEATERKAAAIHTWPFDTRTLNRFAAVVLSVVIILLSRYLSRLLLGL